MFTDEQIRYLDKYSDNICDVCQYKSDCNGMTSDGNGNPVYPPCADADDYEDYVSLKLLEEVMGAG